MSKRIGENLGVLANQHGAFSPSEKAEAAFDLVSRIKDLEARNADLTEELNKERVRQHVLNTAVTRACDMETKNAELLATLVEARESIEHRAIYSDTYSREKYGIDGDLAKIDAVIERSIQ